MSNLNLLRICLLGIWFGSPALAQNVEEYRAFYDIGIYDQSVSNAAANALVETGIASENLEVVDLTLRAMSELAVFKISGFPHPSDPLPERTFNEIPGLKAYLIETYFRELGRTGSNSMEASLKSIEAVQDRVENHPELMAELFPHKERSFAQGLHSYIRFTDDLRPVWPTIPKILCAFWAGELQVHDFIWEAHAIDRSPDITFTTLARLNDCRFTTYEANSFRMSQLQLVQGDDKPGASATVMIASDGLALSNPPEALTLLVQAGVERPQAWDHVVGALVGYSDEQLDAHAETLGRLVRNKGSLVPNDPELAPAIDRLRARYE